MGKTTTLTRYSQLDTYLLQTYATRENIADSENETKVFSQPPNKTPLQYDAELVTKAIRCGDLYKEHDMNEIFTKGLEKFIRQSMKGYWPSQNSTSFHNLDATLLLKLQENNNGYQMAKSM